MTPDPVSIVICHIMAYWTMDEPNREIPWLVRNKATSLTQFLFACSLISFMEISPIFQTLKPHRWNSAVFRLLKTCRTTELRATFGEWTNRSDSWALCTMLSHNVPTPAHMYSQRARHPTHLELWALIYDVVKSVQTATFLCDCRVSAAMQLTVRTVEYSNFEG